MCYTVPRTNTIKKLYKRKDIVLQDTYITGFHKKLSITKIQKLAFNFTLVHILGTHHCDKEQCDTFKCQISLHEVLC